MKRVEKYPVFVYGTLMQDQPNFEYGFGRYGDKVSVGDAVIEDHVLLIPHADASFPYLAEVEALPGDLKHRSYPPVKGQMVTVPASVWDECIDRLDHLEGISRDHYRRKLATVKVVGVEFKAWVYFLGNEHVPSLFFDPIIGNGDWAKYLYERRVR